MWGFLPEGFFSAVQDKKDPNMIVVRARIKGDLDNLRARFVPTLGPTIGDEEGSDYPYRAYVPREDFALGAYKMVMDGITYTNFKSAVSSRRGHDKYYTALTKIWGIMAQFGMNMGWKNQRKADLPYLDSHGPEGYGPPNDEVWNGQVVQRNKRGNPRRRRPKKD